MVSQFDPGLFNISLVLIKVYPTKNIYACSDKGFDLPFVGTLPIMLLPATSPF